MKPLLQRWADHGAFGFGAPISTTLLLLAGLTASAQTTPFTATGWVNGLLTPGITCTNALGQVLVRSLVHTVRVQGTDPRVTGQVLITVDGGYNTNGTANLQGPAYLQVGTWDAAGTNFTATAGMWEMNWHGVMETNYSVEISITGYGSGGAIDGWRLEETLIRAAASSPVDPTVPYLYTGTIKPPPVNTSAAIDNFDDNKLTGWYWNGVGTQYPLLEANQQLTVRGQWQGVHQVVFDDAFAWAVLNRSWSVENDSTLELRADLVRLSEDATNMAAIYLAGTWENGQFYSFIKGHDFVMLGKYGLAPVGESVFACDRAVIKSTNLVLSLALTRVDPNVVLTARVLDKDNQNAVLYERSVVDTPAVDRCLTTDEVLAASGMNLAFLPDRSGAPYISGAAVVLGTLQYTDGNQPVAAATFDNVALRTSEVPGIGIERAVRLSWPASASVNYSVEGAPTLQGPFVPVQDLVTPGMNQMTVPASDLMRFFRLVNAP